MLFAFVDKTNASCRYVWHEVIMGREPQPHSPTSLHELSTPQTAMAHQTLAGLCSSPFPCSEEQLAVRYCMGHEEVCNCCFSRLRDLIALLVWEHKSHPVEGEVHISFWWFASYPATGHGMRRRK